MVFRLPREFWGEGTKPRNTDKGKTFAHIIPLSNVLPSLCHLSKFELSSRASLVAQRLKHLPGMQETQVQSLGWEDPLEKEMATHSSTLA